MNSMKPSLKPLLNFRLQVLIPMTLMTISTIVEKIVMSKVVIRSPIEEDHQDRHFETWSEELKPRLMLKLGKRSQKHHQVFQRNSGKGKGKGFNALETKI